MTSKHIIIIASIATGLFVAGCDEEAAATYTDMDFEQRVTFMTEVVLPEMREVFIELDAGFADMTCATCHGEGASDGSYAMPNPRLPRLPATEEGFFKYNEDPEHARWSLFMVEQVWPQMADLLAMPVFDPKARPDGFSCHNCHMVEGE